MTERDKIYNKFNGRCALCGDHLQKGWHIWDINPIHFVVTEVGKLEKIGDNIENMIPACKSCGSIRVKHKSIRGKMTIEDFRKEIYYSFEYLKTKPMGISDYNTAKRFGLIEETKKSVRFYFETLKQKSWQQ